MILLVLLPALFSLSASLTSRNVTIQNGTIVGFSVTAGSSKAWQFLGIPFAEKPVRFLRFAKPQPLRKRWSGPLVADKAPNRCPQEAHPHLIDRKVDKALVSRFDEDCLYLNIWTPYNTSQPKAVMIWLHGGGYMIGEGLPMYHGAPLSALHDVVVITVHYRLGALGFLRLGGEVGGNWGLFDQQAALRWVQENIVAFGGDSGRVTLFGESAGASCVTLHLLNPQSARLFHRAVAQSGAALANWAFSHRPARIADEHRRFAGALNCSGPALLQCLRTKAAKDLVAQQAAFRWLPVVDGDFLLAAPPDLRPARKDVMMGVAEDEGGMITEMFATWAKSNASQETLEEMLAEKLFANLPHYPDKTSSFVTAALAPLLRSHVDPKDASLNRKRISRAIGDACFVCPMNQFADSLERHGAPPFIFLFNHRSSFSPYPPYVGPTHGEEIVYVFRMDVAYPHLVPMTEEEKDLASRMARDWTNFARTGRPASKTWKRFSASKKEFFAFALPGGPRQGGLHRDDCAFWTITVPSLQAAEGKCRVTV